MSIEERLARGEYSQVECYEMGKLDAFKEMKVDDKGYQMGWSDAVEAICDWLDDELYQTQTDSLCYPTDIACQTYYEKTELFEALRKAMEGKV